MGTQRIQAFSDGVIAVIITLTVFGISPPKDATLPSLLKVVPIFLTYMLSFTVVGIMWINHHHLMHLAKHADAAVMWANNLLLFCMSLVPFVTSYMGNNHGAPLPVAVYGAVMSATGGSFSLLRWAVNKHHRFDASLEGYNRKVLHKSIFTGLLYGSSMPLAFVSTKLSLFIFILIPAMYFLPERKIAEEIEKSEGAHNA